MKKITDNVYFIGSSGCDIYIINSKSEDGLILIDCGMDLELIKSIKEENLDPMYIKHCIITHCHIDHIDACFQLREFNPDIKFYAHELDANAIEEEGFNNRTAASWYGIEYKPIKLYKKLVGDINTLNFGNLNLKCIHTPGHTPGSISIFLEINQKKILFGQDIHGPFSEEFNSNLNDYYKSMKKLIDLNADFLCEGHYGIITPADEVKRFIQSHLKRNTNYFL
ncbi:MAG: MBL fold metallo-hydrolase [Candidatus Lokiarchaeota archaeon]|nr:MBL fold metallo-hydrolase [Candidatus Lokiarchaeota archaeon]